MLKSVFRKIANNFWLFFCLILGSLLITAILAAIPIYTDGALRKMLDVELNKFANNNDEYVSPGEMYGVINYRGEYGPQLILDTISSTTEEFNEAFEENEVKINDSFRNLKVRYLRNLENLMLQNTTYSIQSMTGFEKHVNILQGKMCSDNIKKDVIEVVVSKEEYNINHLVLDNVYTMYSTRYRGDEDSFIKIKVVGVFEIKYEDVEYWHSGDLDNGLQSVFMTSDAAFEEYFFRYKKATSITNASWCYNVDLYGLKKDELEPYININKKMQDHFDEMYDGTAFLEVPINETLLEYIDKSETLELTMWILNAPVLVMLLFYTYMVAKMVIDDDKNEISSLKCRGAFPQQIFYRYFLECGVISVFSLIAGPPLGLMLAKMIGASNGFLEFVNRGGMELTLLPSAYLYALAAAVVFMVMVLIPAHKATKTTIVQHKQKKARRTTLALWEKMGLDFILLAASIYLLYVYKRTDLISSDGTADMSIYFISTVFIFACGMIFLRLYPLILKLIFRFTRKRMSPTLFSTFVQVSRNKNENRFLIMFLILTVSVGIYSSNTAGIVNTNAEDIAKYKSGADIVVSPDWQLDSVVSYEGEDGSIITGTMADMPAKYRNFATDPFLNTKGVEAMTKVANIDGAFARETIIAGEWARNVRIMALEPYNFTQVSWIRPSTFNKDIHWYYYMNQMQNYPTSVMISRSLAEACEIKPGYTVDISFTGKILGEERYPDASCFVLGVFDYWPTYYEDYEYAEMTDYMIIMNLDYVMTLDDTTTYDLWLKKADDVSSSDIYADWEKRGLTENVTKISDRQTAINAEKADSLVMALNGLFSMGFIATMIISFMGFLLYWLLSVRKRRLQFGVLRAMGLSKFKLSLMLFWEHMMTSGISVIVGVFVGYLTSYLYLPVLEKTFTTLLPLTLSYNTTDNLKVFLLVAVMIISGIVVLSRYISKLKINEAVKIGEE